MDVLYAYIYANMHVCIYICIFHVQMYVCRHTYMYVQYMCAYACIAYIWAFIQWSFWMSREFVSFSILTVAVHIESSIFFVWIVTVDAKNELSIFRPLNGDRLFQNFWIWIGDTLIPTLLCTFCIFNCLLSDMVCAAFSWICFLSKGIFTFRSLFCIYFAEVVSEYVVSECL